MAHHIISYREKGPLMAEGKEGWRVTCGRGERGDHFTQSGPFVAALCGPVEPT